MSERVIQNQKFKDLHVGGEGLILDQRGTSNTIRPSPTHKKTAHTGLVKMNKVHQNQSNGTRLILGEDGKDVADTRIIDSTNVTQKFHDMQYKIEGRSGGESSHTSIEGNSNVESEVENSKIKVAGEGGNAFYKVRNGELKPKLIDTTVNIG